MSERKKVQLFLLASLVAILISSITHLEAFFYVAMALLGVVIASDLIFGK